MKDNRRRRGSWFAAAQAAQKRVRRLRAAVRRFAAAQAAQKVCMRVVFTLPKFAAAQAAQKTETA